MPRPRRDDFRPLVRIPNQELEREARAAFSNRLGRNQRLKLIETKDAYTKEDAYVVIYHRVRADFVRWANQLAESDKRFERFNYEVFDKLTDCFEVSKCVEQTERDPLTGELHTDENADGVLNRMAVVGCRVTHAGLSELAYRIGVSKAKLEKQLRLYREIDLVVNDANVTAKRLGFIEISAMVAWRGSSAHREAYLNLSRGKLFDNAALAGGRNVSVSNRPTTIE